MTNALRIATVQRGYDPRDLVMVAFGGAGPLHANRLCAEMQIPLLIIPPSPGTASAFGLLVTDLKHEFSRGRLMDDLHQDVEEINRMFQGLEAQGEDALIREAMKNPEIRFFRQIEMRYAGQSYELSIDCPGGKLTEAGLDSVRKQFHSEHDRTYGHGYPGEPIEIVNLRLTAVGLISKPRFREISSRGDEVSAARKGVRPVFLEDSNDFVEAPIYDRSLLGAGHSFDGPAVVEEMDSTTLIEPGFTARVDEYGNLLVSPKQRSVTGNELAESELSSAGSPIGNR
jgi:N-methylhydantoinase A